MKFGQPQRGTQIRLGIAAGVLLLCALLLGWSAGGTPLPASLPPAALSWALPKPRTDNLAKDLAAIRARRPWGTGVGPSTTARANKRRHVTPKWRLAGVVKRGDERFALIAIGKKFDYRRVGDRLPDDSVLVRITTDGAVSKGTGSSSDRQHVYRLFGKRL